MTNVIETERLTKSYGSHRGIIEVDLAVHEAEVFTRQPVIQGELAGEVADAAVNRHRVGGRLALTANLGQPMVGDWDLVGITVCGVLAIGGVLLGAWGMARRDVSI